MADRDESLIWQTAERMFADLADDPKHTDALWTALVDNGLTATWVPEELGGVGGEIADGYDVIRLAGRYAADVPLVEMLVAGRVAALGGHALPEGTVTVAPARPGVRVEANEDGSVVSAQLAGVPFASVAARTLLGLDDERVALMDVAAGTLKGRQNNIGAGRSDLGFARQSPGLVFAVPTLLTGVSRLDIEGCVARAVQTAGALEAVLAISVQYAREREAFGRPIAKFQAVQHMLAQIAEEVAAALTAARSAADTLATPPMAQGKPVGDGGGVEAGVLLEVASAKVRVSEAADKAMQLAHQVHGAIGITNDYRLQRYARLVIGWRDDFGAPAAWAKRLGEVVARGGGRSIWPTLTTR